MKVATASFIPIVFITTNLNTMRSIKEHGINIVVARIFISFLIATAVTIIGMQKISNELLIVFSVMGIFGAFGADWLARKLFCKKSLWMGTIKKGENIFTFLLTMRKGLDFNIHCTAEIYWEAKKIMSYYFVTKIEESIMSFVLDDKGKGKLNLSGIAYYDAMLGEVEYEDDLKCKVRGHQINDKSIRKTLLSSDALERAKVVWGILKGGIAGA